MANRDYERALVIFQQSYKEQYDQAGNHAKRGSASDAYCMWATVRMLLRNPSIDVLSEQVPRGHRSLADNIARQIKKLYGIWAPVEAGANLRRRWNHPDKPNVGEFNRRAVRCTVEELQCLDQNFLQYVLSQERPLAPGQLSLPPASLSRAIQKLVGLPEHGRMIQGLVYAIAKVKYGRIGWFVRSKKSFASDAASRSRGDVEVMETESAMVPLVVFEVTATSATEDKVTAMLSKYEQHDTIAIFLARSVRPVLADRYLSDQSTILTLKDYISVTLADFSHVELTQVLEALREYLVQVEEWGEGLNVLDRVLRETGSA